MTLIIIIFSDDFSPLNCKQSQDAKRGREVPPYNGWGSEEDSLCSCMALLPKPPKRDFIKFMEKDRHGLDSNVIRFLAKMDTPKAIDAERRFIISYFLSDDTIQVFEPVMRNSGNFVVVYLDQIIKIILDSHFLNSLMFFVNLLLQFDWIIRWHEKHIFTTGYFVLVTFVKYTHKM